MFEYKIVFANHPYTVVAKSASSAKYKFWKLFLEEFNETFPINVDSIKKIGQMKVSSFFTDDLESFKYMKTYRSLGDWCQLGTRVLVSGKEGFVIGAYDCNLNVLFGYPENPVAWNVHPHSCMKYFDSNGMVVKEYGE